MGAKIARSLGRELSMLEERSFEDGEHKLRPLEPVAGCDVYVVHSLHGGPEGSPNDKLCRMLFLVGALKDAGAARVTAVAPYLCYARKDRRTKGRIRSLFATLQPCSKRPASMPSLHSRSITRPRSKMPFDVRRLR
nr:ribose-phosphate pyrophosphokinase-like domain-containing protein [Bradyrhizobium sp.]